MTSIRAGVHFDIHVGYGDIVSFQKDGMPGPRIGRVRKIDRITPISQEGLVVTAHLVHIRSWSYSRRRFDDFTCEPWHISQRIAE